MKDQKREREGVLGKMFQSPCGEVVMKEYQHHTIEGFVIKGFQSPCGEVVMKVQHPN